MIEPIDYEVEDHIREAIDELDARIAVLEKALEVAHADLLKWGGKPTKELNMDLGKISYALNSERMS